VGEGEEQWEGRVWFSILTSMKKTLPLVLAVVFTIFAQQQDAIPASMPVPMPAPAPMPVLPATDGTVALPITADSTAVLPVPMQDTTPVLVPAAPPPLLVPAPLLAPEPPIANPVALPPMPLQDTIQPSPPPPPAPKSSMPRNVITVDLGPTIIGFIVGIAGDQLLDENAKTSALGFAAQYEFQFIKYLSLALKFGYMQLEAGFVNEYEKTLNDVPNVPNIPNIPDVNLPGNMPDIELPTTELTAKGEAEFKAALSIYSIEAHPRVYPFGGAFFLEGIVGYSNLTADFSGEAVISVKTPDDLLALYPELGASKDSAVSANYKIPRSYLKYGGKLGWRIDFGEPGGFTFEHALGFYGASGFGKTIVKRLSDSFAEDYEYGEVDIKQFDDAFSILEKVIFVGGPRYTFAFGWRF